MSSFHLTYSMRSEKVIMVTVNPRKSAHLLYCVNSSYNLLFPSAHSTKAPGKTRSAVERRCPVIFWDTHDIGEWPGFPLPSWQHFHLKGVFMVLASLSAYLNSITQDSRADFRVMSNSTCPASWTMRGTSLNQTPRTHQGQKHIPTTQQSSFTAQPLDTTTSKSLNYANYFHLCFLPCWLKQLQRGQSRTSSPFFFFWEYIYIFSFLFFFFF